MIRHAVAASIALAWPAQATTNCAADAMIVFDGSGSMDEISLEGPPRILDARKATREALPQVEPFRDLGLLIYGPGAQDGCSNIDLRFAPRPDAAGAIIDAVEQLRPGGMTPLSASVAKAAEVLSYQTRPATIVLVTDGNETCGGTPCALGNQLEAAAADLTIHVIGFRIRYDFFGWNNPEQAAQGRDTVAKCLADKTGGLFVSTETVGELVEALTDTLGCPLIGLYVPATEKPYRAG